MSATPNRVLVVGNRGMLGRAWCALLGSKGVAHRGVDIDDIDITDARQVAQLAGYDVIVNCAAWTNVDGAETNEAAATKLNADAVEYLAARAKTLGATLIHYSTDYVFNGHATTPYTVDQPREPLNAYGRTKAAGEERLEQSGCDYRLVRTSWLYAPWGKNFVLTMLRLTKEKPALKVVSDQRGRPTSSEHLAATSFKLLDAAPGTYHVTDGGECTWYDFTVKIAQLAGHTNCIINPCTSAEYPLPAKRPAYSVLDLSKTEAAVGPMPDWTVNLRSVLTGLQDREGSTG